MTEQAWLAGPVIAALALGALGVRHGAGRAAAWAIAGLAGQAATLLLIRAGRDVGYQHLATGVAQARVHPVAAILALFVLLIVAAESVRRRQELVRRFRQSPRDFSIALVVASLLAAAPSAAAGTWATELALASLLQLASLGCVYFAIAAIPQEAAVALRRALDTWLAPDEGPARLDRLAWVLAGAFVVVAAILSVASYQGHPHVPDEVAYLIHARYFAAGLPWMAPPPVPAAFDTFLIELAGDRWYSVFPPGWPAVLAIGVRIGVPWLVNPLLGALAILLTYRLVWEIADRRVARLATLLLAASPWHLFTAMTLMSHTLSLVLALCCALGALLAWRGRSWWHALGAGLALGILGMSRPLEGVAMAAIVGLPLAIAGLRNARLTPAIALGIGTLVTGVLGLAYNRVLTGSAFVFPAERYFDRFYGPGRYSIGFGPEKGLGWPGLDPFPGHGAIDVVVNSVLNGFMVNVDLFGWWTGSIVLLVFGAVVAKGTFDRAMLAAIALVVGLHSFFWFSGGPDVGARYWYLLIVPMVVLSARGLLHLDERSTDATTHPSLATAGAGLLTLMALATFVPWRASDKYHAYRGMTPPPRSWTSDPRFEDALVLVSGVRHPAWASAAPYNPIDLTAETMIFAWDRDPETRRAVLAAFPNRPVWLVAGPTHESPRFVVLRGPIAPGERALLERP